MATHANHRPAANPSEREIAERSTTKAAISQHPKNLDFGAVHAVSTRSFKKPPGAAPIEVSLRPGGAKTPEAAGDVR